MKCNGMLVVLIFVVLSSTVWVQTSVQFGFLLRTHTENFTTKQSPGMQASSLMIDYKCLVCSVDKKPTRCHYCVILYFSFTSCSTCFGQPCAHLQELTTA